ncbi:MAG: hypothetical protein Q7J84_14455 [Sulfuricaulis sp.]|nr:hypothetical protein [Sulfuricaulis sp.]
MGLFPAERARMILVRTGREQEGTAHPAGYGTNDVPNPPYIYYETV